MGRRSLKWLACGIGVLSSLGVAGCQPAAKMSLVQPRLSGRQSQLTLASETARWAGAGDERAERILAEFPLPGAVTGRPTYVLYLRLPAGQETVSFDGDVDADPNGLGLGFFVQTRGEYAGLSRVTGGTVRVRGTSQARNAGRSIEFDLTCEDGSRMAGKVQATRDEYFVSQFETRRQRADVKMLVSQPGQPASRPRR